MTDGSPDLVVLSSIATLRAAQEYWIVIRPVNGVYSVSYDEYSNISSSMHEQNSVVVSSNNGSSWDNATNGFAAIQYSLMSPATPLPTFTSYQIFSDLLAYHNFPTSSGELKGWNAYIQVSRVKLFQNGMEWLSTYTGRSGLFLAFSNLTFWTSVCPEYITSLMTAHRSAATFN